MSKQDFRELAIAVLDDENGTNAQGYIKLQEMAKKSFNNECDDIFAAVESQNNRFFLPETHGLI